MRGHIHPGGVRRRRNYLVLISLLAISAIYPRAAKAAVYTVDANGTGNFTTIQACANAAVAGDTCLVSTGTYPEHVLTKRDGTATARITFRTSGAVTMQGFDIKNQYVTIEGFTISGYANLYSGQIYVTATASYCEILNNTVNAPGAKNISGIYLFGSDAGPLNCLISGNTLSHQTYPFLQLYGANHLVQNNTFDHQDSEDYIRLFGSNMNIRRNVFWQGSEVLNSGQHPDLIQTFEPTGDSLTIANNMFVENWVQDLSVYRTDLVARSNNVVHSDSRPFDANNGDLQAYIRIAGGPGWTPGLYRITAINNGDATVDTPVGNAPLSGGLWWYGGSQVTQLNSSVGGTLFPSAKVYNLSFLRNVFVNIEFNANNVMPGVRFQNNTFYLGSWGSLGLGYGSGGLTRGSSENGYVANNAFISGGNGRSGTGYYSMGGEGLSLETVYEMITFEPILSHPLASAIWANLQANGYINSNGDLQPPARALANISQLVWTLNSTYDAFKSTTYDILVQTVALDTLSRASFHAGHNYVYPAKPTGPCDSPDGGITFYQFANQKWCEGIPALNGTPGKFLDLSNPLGPDGIPFTLDDGLKPAPGSPLCNAGEHGSDIGAYSCDPNVVFSTGLVPPANLVIKVK